ncbi:MAG: DUF92 domain-containing protein [Candidatus Omnitrophica bacterium]|nr:DUF92 domain-containing protein [Candidatus Omnitrophota bacterium]
MHQDVSVLYRLLIGFVINVIIGIIAFMREMVDDTGFFAGVILFTCIYVFLDWQAYVIVAVFFFITGVSIDIENKDKAEKGEFELYKAKRPIDRVLGRSLAGAIFAGLFFMTAKTEFKLAFIATYAEAAFDAIATKIGKLLSKEAMLITDFKRVHRGTPGAISRQGTLAGLLAAAILAIAGFFTKMVLLPQVFIILIAAFFGSMLDSYLNAYSYQKNRIHNEMINFISSAAAGLLCIVIDWIFIYLVA